MKTRKKRGRLALFFISLVTLSAVYMGCAIKPLIIDVNLSPTELYIDPSNTDVSIGTVEFHIFNYTNVPAFFTRMQVKFATSDATLKLPSLDIKMNSLVMASTEAFSGGIYEGHETVISNTILPDGLMKMVATKGIPTATATVTMSFVDENGNTTDIEKQIGLFFYAATTIKIEIDSEASAAVGSQYDYTFKITDQSVAGEVLAGNIIILDLGTTESGSADTKAYVSIGAEWVKQSGSSTFVYKNVWTRGTDTHHFGVEYKGIFWHNSLAPME